MITVRKKDMKDAYRKFTSETWSDKKALTKVWTASWEMAINSVNCRKHLGYYEASYPVEEFDDDPHLGCFSYPNCDIDPNGCCVLHGMDAEPYGHRD